MQPRSVRKPTISIGSRLQDFDRDQNLSEKLEPIGEILAEVAAKLANVFWNHYLDSVSLRGRWTEDQVENLTRRTTRYFELRISEPLSQDWADDALELANSAHAASISITFVLAALTSVHGYIRRLLFSKLAGDRLLNALDASDRLNILEAEIITTQIHQLNEQEVAQQREEVLREFEAEIISAVQAVSTQTAQSNNSAANVLGSMDAVGEVSSELKDILQDHTVSVAAVASATSELVRSLKTIRQEIIDIDVAATSSINSTNEADLAFEKLSQEATNASGIIKMIREILENSEILSLNAQIESARSDSGSNAFGVIAAEMRDLATQTRNAIVKVDDQVSAMQSAAKDALSAATSIKQAIESTANATSTVGAMADEQERILADVDTKMRQISSFSEHIFGRFASLDSQLEQIAQSSASLLGVVEANAKTTGELEGASKRFAQRLRSKTESGV